VLRVGVALGSGSARGWAHIGVLRELAAAGVQPAVICGSSIGALVGAAAAAGRLEPLAEWVSGLEWWDIVRYVVEPGSGGLVDGERVMRAYAERVGEVAIEALPVSFGAVATELASGRELWLREGPLLEAVRASMALPGLFAPVRRDGRWLVDGGLVNPVPVSLCRAMGADLVIAVNLNHQLATRHARSRRRQAVPAQTLSALGSRLQEALRGGAPALAAWLVGPPRQDAAPSIFDVLAGALNIMQDQITRSRMAGDPPDLVIAPRLDHLALLDFDRAEEAIVEGQAAVRRALPGLRDLYPGIAEVEPHDSSH
jgi:NTE family protein